VGRFEIAFTILAAISVVDALDEVGLADISPTIKWVNDVLLGEGKVAGVLAYTQTQAALVTSAVLGIGINVEATPDVDPTPFVPEVTSVREHMPPLESDAREQIVLALLRALDRNYRTLLSRGLDPLLEKYRRRSTILGQEVTICSEVSDQSLQALATGRVVRIGDNLELFLEGHPEPVRAGRLALGRVADNEEESHPGSPEGPGKRSFSSEGPAMMQSRIPSWPDPQWRQG
jgi:biotin-(acetyl-CoA carboxylase) ligase